MTRLAGIITLAFAGVSYSAQHPLDPLSSDEIETVVSVLQEEGHVDLTALYPLVTLDEPTKNDVLQWRPGEVLSRRAFVITKNRRQTFEAIVDLEKRKVLRWEEVEGVEANFLLSEEWSSAQRLAMASRELRDAITRRGLELRDVVCVPNTAGYFGIAAQRGRRLAKVVCYHAKGIQNFWGRPIEGVLAVVDLGEGKVLSVLDEGDVPVPSGPVDFDETSVGDLRTPPKPIAMVQPEGRSFIVEGNEVSWQKWSFHFRSDPRVGLVVSLVRYEGRSILYQGSLSELFVPYMDPGLGWYFKTYLDAGEYGVGRLASELVPGADCPEGASLFDAVFADDWGEPYSQKGVACVFERYAGEIAWRHHEAVTGATESRKRVDLVLRQVATIGNYDYVFDWTFQQNGSINVSVKATGVSQVKGVEHDSLYGRMVSPHTLAVNHDHFFSYRLDLDVDGTENSFLLDRLVTQRLGADSPRKSLWVVESERLESEKAARVRISLEKPALWRVVNPSVTGPMGYPVGYQLKPGTNAVSLLSPDDYPQRRAGFTDYHLWVTPYSPRERYAAGRYPNQSRGGGGLPKWTSADRTIVNRDLVLWYTLGFHHVVRAEDWPVLPTSTTGFELRPFDFFERNPALDLPEGR